MEIIPFLKLRRFHYQKSTRICILVLAVQINYFFFDLIIKNLAKIIMNMVNVAVKAIVQESKNFSAEFSIALPVIGDFDVSCSSDGISSWDGFTVGFSSIIVFVVGGGELVVFAVTLPPPPEDEPPPPPLELPLEAGGEFIVKFRVSEFPVFDARSVQLIDQE